MKIALIAIGDEVLAGFTLNTNAAFIGRHLFAAGLSPTSHLTLPDGGEAFENGLRKALEENDLVITTGGLGPTFDDRTLELVEKTVGPLNRATELENRVGTAPGLILSIGKSTLILLPGVPIEMETLFVEEVFPRLQELFPKAGARNVDTASFFQLPEVQIDPVLQRLEKVHPDVAFGIYPHLGSVTVRMSGRGSLEKVRQELVATFPENYFDGESLEEAVHETCVAKGFRFATAESCTGGAIGATLTKWPGASNYFAGGIIAYSNEIKENFLGVREATLEEHGAVSGEVVGEMVVGLIDRMGVDVGVAVSGIAGPDGGTPEKPVGTVWCAAARKGEAPIISTFVRSGTRASIIHRTINWALAETYKLIR